jgi:hypothetical protein
MRKSTVYLAFMGLCLIVMSGLLVHASNGRRDAAGRFERSAAMVKEYRLTDLSLFTEARYTRHPSMADLNTAFQDYPFSFEHFPSGSLVPVPQVVRRK